MKPLLERWGLFAQYEDRFLALFRRRYRPGREADIRCCRVDVHFERYLTLCSACVSFAIKMSFCRHATGRCRG